MPGSIHDSDGGPVDRALRDEWESGKDRDFVEEAVRAGYLPPDEVSKALSWRRWEEKEVGRPIPIEYVLYSNGWLSLPQLEQVRLRRRRRELVCPICQKLENVFGLRPDQVFACPGSGCRLRVPGSPVAPMSLPEGFFASEKTHVDEPGAEGAVASRAHGAQELRLFNEHRLLLAPYGLELTDIVGRGGMGVLYKAIQNPLRRIVAVKLLLLPPPVDAEDVKRFCREARCLAAVAHPNLAGVHWAGRALDDHYIVLHWVPGRNLGQLLAADGPLPATRALGYALDVARALSALHAAKIVHRDVKPSNVMVRSDGVAVLIDLGLARTLLRDGGSVLTRTGHKLGTPCYMSPEQYRDPRSVTPASDLYSLGATLWELLAGARPFAHVSSWVDLDRLFETQSAPRLEPAQPGVPAGVVDFVARLMDFEPSRRPQRAAEVVTELRRLLFDCAPTTEVRGA